MDAEQRSQGRLFHSNNITGAIGEHMACIDLIKKGYFAHLAGSQFPYDIVVDIKERLYRVQVKASATTSKVSGRAENGYGFRVRHGVVGHDIIAFVAVDIGVVGYLPSFQCNKFQMQFKAPGTDYHPRRKGFNLDHFTIENAIKELHQHEKEKENIL